MQLSVGSNGVAIGWDPTVMYHFFGVDLQALHRLVFQSNGILLRSHGFIKYISHIIGVHRIQSVC